MYVVWKTRSLLSHSPCLLCGGSGGNRLALIPHLVASRRVRGRPTQLHLARLPSIRSCCLHDKAVVGRWWQQVDEVLAGFVRPTASGYTLTENQARELRHKMEARMGRARAGHGPDTKQHRQPQGASPRHLASPLRVLGLSWPCRPDEIKAAFRQRAKQTHPDAGGRSEAFREVYEAYSTLLKVVSGPLR